MRRVLVRVVGLLLAAAGGALLAYLARALYTPTMEWVDVVVAINMPRMLLLTLLGAALIGAGLWMLLHPAERRDRPRPRPAIRG
jgi:hypothetical protein